ncbi:Protein PAT1-like 1 [Papilio xuthus]|uniref:Protein PAT1-like 1 n=1 Tax=Papilio xuthus TaxID=66420 RepID=A0A194PU32_PAPXU|nr:Protein PAT1-like 1 [Papilio xuthus]
MADSFFGFDTSFPNLNDDEGGGGPSEDEYDALNDETFGQDSDELDWEVEHEQLAEQLESSRRHHTHIDDDNLQLEASLSKLVLDEPEPVRLSLGSSVWRHDLSFPTPAAATPVPPLKNVCTVEELERQLRQGQVHQQLQPQQQQAAFPGQNYYQQRFPTMILQRPPGLQAPVPLPFAPQQPIGHNNSQMSAPLNNIVGQSGQMNQMTQGNQAMQNHIMQNVNSLGQNMGQMTQNANHLNQINQMTQNNPFMQNNQVNPQFQNNQMGQTMMNQMQHNMQNVHQMSQSNHMLQNQMGQNMSQMDQTMAQMSQSMNQMLSNGSQYRPGMNQFSHMLGQSRIPPPPGMGMQRQNFTPSMNQFNPNFRGPMSTNKATEQQTQINQNMMINQHLNNQPLINQNIVKPVMNSQQMTQQNPQQLANQQITAQHKNSQQINSQQMNSQQMNLQQINPQQMNLQQMNPQQMNLQQMNPQQMNLQQMNPQQMNPQQLNPQQLNPQQMNPQQMNPQQMNPQQMNPQQMNPQQMNPQQMNSQQMNPQQSNSQPMNLQMNPQQTNIKQTNQQINSKAANTQQMNVQHISPQNKGNQAALKAVANQRNEKVQKSRVYNNTNTKMMTSQNLAKFLIQSTYPVLPYTSFHNASHHPMLNRGAVFTNSQLINNHPMFNNQRSNGTFNHVNRHMMNGDDNDVGGAAGAAGAGGEVDEYAGLMTAREKQWLINIQMLQLNTGTPYIHDFYYTVFLERQSNKEKEGIKEAHKANQQNHPFYSGGVKQEAGRERHNSHRHNSSSEEAAPRHVTAPRKIIDVEVVSAEPASGRTSRAPSVASTTNPAEVPREVRRTKQVLLDIEALYVTLLRLEELNDPLAIANALILKEREEKQKQLEAAQKEAMENEAEDESNLFLKNIESVQRRPKQDSPKSESIDKRQVVNLAVSQKPPPVKNLLDEDREELLGRMFAALLHADRLPQILAVRKGRALVARFASRAPVGHVRMRALWSRVLRALPHAARRDDGGLAALAPHYRRYIQNTTAWSPVLESCAILAETIDPARTPHALTTPLTLSCVCAMLEKAATLVNTPEATSSERQWYKFLKSLARALKNTGLAVARPLQPLPDSKVLLHLKQLDSRSTIEILQRGRTTAEFADLTKADVSEQLVKHLC